MIYRRRNETNEAKQIEEKSCISFECGTIPSTSHGSLEAQEERPVGAVLLGHGRENVNLVYRFKVKTILSTIMYFVIGLC